MKMSNDGIAKIICECGNDSFYIIETADWLPDLGMWEGNEKYHVCVKCGKKIDCSESLPRIGIDGEDLKNLRGGIYDDS